MNLRPYQTESIESINRHFRDKTNKQVIVLATGLGKTVIFVSLLADYVQATHKKALIIAHREELLQQAKEKIEAFDSTLKIGIEKAEQVADPDCDVIIASVQTLGRTGSERIKKFDPKDFCVVVIDEAHHASAETYKNVLKHFGLLKVLPTESGQVPVDTDWNKECLLLGVTATPQRNDNEGIDKIFDTVAYEFNIIQGIEKAWLSRIKAYRVRTATDLTSVHKTAGDFNLGELGDAVNNEDRNALIIKTYKTLTPGKQALCFAVNVEHAQELCKHFIEQGIASSYVLGSTPREERIARLQAFAKGDIKVMVNAMVLTEGYDNSSIEVVLMARPTQSGILFQQMVGRGTRLHEGKEHLTVIDFVDNTYRQNLKTTASLLGIPGNLDFKGEDILAVKGKVDKLLDLAPNYDLEKLDIDKIKYALEEVDLLSGLKIPDELVPITKFEWHRYSEDVYRLYMADEKVITISKTITGQWQIEGSVWDKITGRYYTQVYQTQYSTMESAISKVDGFVQKKYPDQVPLVNSDAKWRKQPPSDAQVRYLRSYFRVPQITIDQLSKGDAARLITKLKMQKSGTM